MFSLVEDGLPDSVLRRKALKLEKVGVHLTGIKIIAECVLCICLMYAILHAGYWVKFLLPCVTTCTYELKVPSCQSAGDLLDNQI
jgi:hypothetical protein